MFLARCHCTYSFLDVGDVPVPCVPLGVTVPCRDTSCPRPSLLSRTLSFCLVSKRVSFDTTGYPAAPQMAGKGDDGAIKQWGEPRGGCRCVAGVHGGV